MKNKAALIILDGWGYREDTKDNAIAAAKKPFFDYLWANYPHNTLGASGHFVGVPDGQIGNSEIGHSTIGAGAILDSDLVRIAKEINNGNYSKNPAFIRLFDHIKKFDSTLHVLGLIGDGGVHAHSSHLLAFLDSAVNYGIKKIAIHLFTDGRDLPPQSAEKYVREVEDKIKTLGVGRIVSISGRYYAMDRDKNWDRTELATKAIFNGEGRVCDKKPSDFVSELYKAGEKDEYLVPIVCPENGITTKLNSNDGIFFFNFRADRARQLSIKILEKLDEMNLFFVTMTEYDEEYKKAVVAYMPIKIKETLAQEISEHGLKQSHLAETEKFAHVTYFLNGGKEEPYPGEKHILVDSRKDVYTHDEAPEMRASGIAENAIKEIDEGADFIMINFANPDMVGHTANVPKIIEAVEAVDSSLKLFVEHAIEKGYVCLISADHGNAELNVDQTTGIKHTAHTTSPVPIIITLKDIKIKSNHGLADIAPTILQIMGIDKPECMTGESLIE